MRGSRRFCQRVSIFLLFLLVHVGREDPPNTTKGWPSLVRQRNDIEMAFRWLVDDDPTLSAGFVAL